MTYTGRELPNMLIGTFTDDNWRRIVFYLESFIVTNERSTSQDILDEVSHCHILINDINKYIIGSCDK